LGLAFSFAKNAVNSVFSRVYRLFSEFQKIINMPFTGSKTQIIISFRQSFKRT